MKMSPSVVLQYHQQHQMLLNGPATAAMLQSPESNVLTVQRASLYVGDLHPETAESDLFVSFSKIGPVVSVHICRCSLTNKSLCYGYVNFYNHTDACKAMACLNHTDLKGKAMRIMWCQRDPSLRKCGVGNLFVKNLDPSVDGTCLLGLFCQFGTVLSCKVAEENGKSKGFGFVQFDSEESAMIARTALHDTSLRGKKLYVAKFVKKSDRTVISESLNFTNIYVKNLVEDVAEDFLRDIFSKYGKVRNVVIMKDGNGKSRGFGFVSFEAPEEARKAVDDMNGSRLGSKILFVGRAQRKAERAEILKHEYRETYLSRIKKVKASNLYVKNLNVLVDEKRLQELFSCFGRITSVKVMRQGNGKSKGFGFVCFSTPEEAKNALDTLNGVNFEGKSLYVAIARSKEDCQNADSLVQSANCTVPPPPYPSYYVDYHPFPLLHQPISYLHQNTNMGIQYPFATQNYPNHYSYYIPMRPEYLGSSGNTNNWANQQHSMTYSSSDVCVQELYRGKYTGLQSGNRKKGSKRIAPVESSYKAAIRSLVATTSPEDGNNAGDVDQPMVNNLQPECAENVTEMVLKMNDSELTKLLNVPNSLAKQADNTVQVFKEANARTSAGDAVELQKPACCLGY